MRWQLWRCPFVNRSSLRLRRVILLLQMRIQPVGPRFSPLIFASVAAGSPPAILDQLRALQNSLMVSIATFLFACLLLCYIVPPRTSTSGCSGLPPRFPRRFFASWGAGDPWATLCRSRALRSSLRPTGNLCPAAPACLMACQYFALCTVYGWSGRSTFTSAGHSAWVDNSVDASGPAVIPHRYIFL